MTPAELSAEYLKRITVLSRSHATEAAADFARQQDSWRPVAWFDPSLAVVGDEGTYGQPIANSPGDLSRSIVDLLFPKTGTASAAAFAMRPLWAADLDGLDVTELDLDDVSELFPEA